MNKNFILNKIKQIIRTNFDWIKEEDINQTEKNLRNDLGFDSIAIVSLQVSIEDEFDIRFNPLEIDFAEVFYSVSSLVNYILALQNK